MTDIGDVAGDLLRMGGAVLASLNTSTKKAHPPGSETE